MAVEEVTPLGPRRRLTPGLMLLGGVASLLVLFVAALGASWLMAKQRVRAELARIRAAGEPVSVEDLDAFYPRPPADRDTTRLWLEAIAALDTPEYRADAKDLPIVGRSDEVPLVTEPWPSLTAAEALLAKYHEPLEKMHDAAQLGGAARYPAVLSLGVDTPVPHLLLLRSGVLLLALEVEVESRHQNPSAAAKAIETIFAAGHSLGMEPLLVSQLVRLNNNHMACDALNRLLPDAGFSDQDLANIDRQLAAVDYTASFRRLVLGERVLGLQAFGNAKSAGIEEPLMMLRASDQAVYLQFMQKLAEMSASPGPGLRDAVVAWEAEIKQFAGEFGAGLRCPISMQILPMFSASVEGIERGIANRDATRAAVAIERYRLRHGTVPKALDALVPDLLPEVPLDPFDGQPLRYRVDEAGYRVYSVGLDGIDQGGDTSAELHAPSPDVVFHVRLSNPPVGVSRGAGVE